MDGLGVALREVVEEAASELDGADHVVDGDRIELRRDGHPFVILADDAAEFLLGPDVAAAALRTPGVTPSGRGAGWIHFRLEELDRFSLDRAASWTALAWRRAAD